MVGRGGRGGGTAGGSKSNAQFVRPEPSFIKKLKEQYGYKTGPTLEDKFQDNEDIEDDNQQDRDDEKPVVVVLKEGDLSQEEADVLMANKAPEDEAPEDGRIRFKKPDKKREHADDDKKDGEDRPIKKKKKKDKQEKSCSHSMTKKRKKANVANRIQACFLNSFSTYILKDNI